MTKWILQRHLKIHTSKDGQTSKQKVRKKGHYMYTGENGMFNFGDMMMENSSENFKHSKFNGNVTMLCPTLKTVPVSPMHMNQCKQSPDHNSVPTVDILRVYAHSEMKRNNSISYSCHQCGKLCDTKEKLAFHLLEHNSIKKSKNMSYSRKHSDEDNDLVSCCYPNETLENGAFETECKNKAGQKSKGTLTTIVSKLHNKVDEKQKEDIIEVQVVETCENESYLKDTGENISKLDHDFNMEATSRQPMSKASDPFISGIIEAEHTTGAYTNNSIVDHGQETGNNKSQQNSEEKHIPNEKQHHTTSFFLQQLAKQNEHIEILQKEFHNCNVKHEKEVINLNSKIDSLTHLISSQSLILNRILLGGKMNVSGTLDFCVQNSGD